MDLHADIVVGVFLLVATVAIIGWAFLFLSLSRLTSWKMSIPVIVAMALLSLIAGSTLILATDR